jgi:protein tyrosine phosphatase (PTP) superfamily phosphohydrolase (DUF442 family)
METTDPRERALEAILAYKRLSPTLGTAGQPTAAQFALVKAAGFELVVNLATDISSGHIPEEPDIVRALGLTYVHIPVVWDSPALEDFTAFCRLMDASSRRTVFVHCAKNWRVSAFMYLYRVLRQGYDPEAALWDMREIWEPDAVWSAFIERMLRG